jgi:hypothetical protein
MDWPALRYLPRIAKLVAEIGNDVPVIVALSIGAVLVLVLRSLLLSGRPLSGREIRLLKTIIPPLLGVYVVCLAAHVFVRAFDGTPEPAPAPCGKCEEIVIAQQELSGLFSRYQAWCQSGSIGHFGAAFAETVEVNGARVSRDDLESGFAAFVGGGGRLEIRADAAPVPYARPGEAGTVTAPVHYTIERRDRPRVRGETRLTLTARHPPREERWEITGVETSEDADLVVAMGVPNR